MTENSGTSTNVNPVDEKLAKQLIRQLKFINFWISFYGIIMIVIMGFLLFMIIQLVIFIQDTNQRIDQLKTEATNSLNVEKKTCESNSTITDWLKANTEFCK